MNAKKVALFSSICAAAVMPFSACSKPSSKKADNNQGNSDASTASLSVNLSVVGTLAIDPNSGSNLQSGGSGLSLARDPSNLFYNVSAPADRLQSLKLHIDSIMVCKEIQTNGTAISKTEGCIQLYSGPASDALRSSDAATALPAGIATTEGYIDIMSAESRKKLSQNIEIKETDIGEYKYGLISWSSPIKVKAELVDPADPETVVLYTKSGQAGQCQVNNNPAYGCMRTNTPMTNGPAEEMVFMSNADIVFKFQKPLTITSDDITNKVSYSLKLAFNPDGLIQGVTPNGATNFPPATDATVNDGYNLGNTMNLVGAQVAPIFYKTSTKVMRESYAAILPMKGFSGAKFKLRVELYTLADDPDRTIYGVSTATLSTPETTSYLTGYARIYGLRTHEDGSIDLLDYEGKGQVGNLLRVAKAGHTTTGKLPCGFLRDNCTDISELSEEVQFTLEALEEIP